MSSRTYLSIGDVLTLLREEFPDVTISKIRFLESQGLVNPERSPSGYRKFFDHDVERLRWVLRQQREYFLPLKVIRDRLAEGNLEGGPMQASEASAVAAEPATNGNATGASHHSGLGGQNGAGDELTKADNEAMARILADASRRAAQLDEAQTQSPTVAPSAKATASAGPAATAPPPLPPSAKAPAGTARHAVRSDHGAETSATTPTTPGRGVDVVAEAVATAGRGGRAADADSTGAPRHAAPEPAAKPPAKADASRPGPTAKPPTGRPPASPTSTTVVTGASLTADELCSASGLSEFELAGLQGFGLIEATNVAGLQTFDEDALTVANLAAELRAFGIEPRHLRLYRNAVDRELGLIEQVIIPLLRQRNPESRQRAVESAEQLGALGQAMRATLLRSALRRHLGG